MVIKNKKKLKIMKFNIEYDPKIKNIERKLNDENVLNMYREQYFLNKKIKPLHTFKKYKYELDFGKFLLKQVEDIFKNG
jgi:hypothetical protein